ncbi:1-acyl-sn-glycerol-3-phosphate acyltransferase [bacterium]|nr:MAG: 1-acyl-sn-glycerol-3-phosphate acyltransferase [bacterium]
MVHDISRFIAFILIKILFRLKVKGIENIPKKGAFILASNHVSYLDPPVVGVSCPRRLSYMARDTLFLQPLFAWWLRKVGVFPVKRNSADISAFKESLRRLAQGGGLLIFPEGTRQKNGVLGSAEPGVGFLVAKTNLPVIPVFVKGTEKILPKDAKRLNLSNITVCFGEQIPLERRMPYQDIALLIMNSIRHLSCTGLN